MNIRELKKNIKFVLFLKMQSKHIINIAPLFVVKKIILHYRMEHSLFQNVEMFALFIIKFRKF